MFVYLFRSLLFLSIFCFFSSIIFSQSSEWLPTLNTSVSSYKLTKPIITKNKVSFIPLVELKSLFGFRVSFNHKLSGYLFKKGDLSLFFPTNSSEVWLNHSKHFLSQPSFFENSCLYIPLADFALLLGYAITKTEQSIHFTPSKSHSFSSASPLVSFQKRHVDSTLLKFKDLSSISHLLYKHKHITLSQSLQTINSITYFDPTLFFSSLGYKTSLSKKGIRLSYNNISYFIPFSSRIWSITIDNQTSHFLSEAPLIQKKSLLFPFSSLLSFLDYSLHHNFVTSSLELLDNIHGISLQGIADPFSIKILSRHTLLTDFDVNSSLGFIQVFNIPFSIIYAPSSIIPHANPYVSKLSTRPLNYTFEQMHANPKLMGKKQTEITLHLTNKASFYPHSHPNGLFLSQNKILEKFSIKENSTMYRITISGFDIDSPSIIKESGKLIFDFPNTITLLNPLKRINDSNFRSIRTSQLSFDPLVSRFVLDFNTKIPTYSIEKKKHNYIITFKKSKAPIVAKSSKQKSKTTSRSIRNKVIILDAGHGGRDPGAISGKSFYEKKYTLDVVNRVKILLEKEGAYVILTRNGDYTRSLYQRTRIANRHKGDLFISVHFNTFYSSKARGSKSFYYKKKDKKLALAIQRQLKKDLSIRSNGIKRSRFYVLRHTKMPSVLIEPLFLSNPREKKLLRSSSFRNSLATSIFKGIKRYYRR